MAEYFGDTKNQTGDGAHLPGRGCTRIGTENTRAFGGPMTVAHAFDNPRIQTSNRARRWSNTQVL